MQRPRNWGRYGRRLLWPICKTFAILYLCSYLVSVLYISSMFTEDGWELVNPPPEPPKPEKPPVYIERIVELESDFKWPVFEGFKDTNESVQRYVPTGRTPTWGKYRFRIHIFAWKRKKSLVRLCESLLNADYMDMEVPLYFFIDGDPLQDVVQYVHSFLWPYGKKFVTVHDHRVGLVYNIPFSWNPEDENELCFFFEDDVEVSPFYFKWTLKLLEKHNPDSDPNLAGFSLAGARLNQHTSMLHQRRMVRYGGLKPASSPHSVTDKYGWTTYGPIVDYTNLSDYTLLAMQAPASWGSLYFARTWKQYYRYLKARDNLPEDQSHKVWIMNSNASTWKRSWKLFLLEFLLARSYYLIYPNLPDQSGYSTNHREQGEHTGRRGESEVVVDALTKEKNWLFTTPIDCIGEHFDVELPDQPPILNLHFQKSTFEELQIMGCSYIRKILRNELPDELRNALLDEKDIERCANTPPELDPYQPYLTFFTTLRKQDIATDGKSSFLVMENFMTNYIRMWPRVETIVYATSEDCKFFQWAYSHECIPLEKLPNCTSETYKLPLLSCLWQDARKRANAETLMYANGDIVILTDLKPILDYIIPQITTPHFLITGQRLDYHPPVSKLWNYSTPEGIEAMKKDIFKNSTLHPAWGVDYYIFNAKNPLIEDMPPFLVGRIRWDNWAIQYCLMNPEISLVDATERILAVHLRTDREEPYVSHKKPGNSINFALAKQNFRLGKLDNAKYKVVNGSMILNKNPEEVKEEAKRNEEVWNLLYKAEAATNFTEVFHNKAKAQTFLRLLNVSIIPFRHGIVTKPNDAFFRLYYSEQIPQNVTIIIAGPDSAEFAISVAELGVPVIIFQESPKNCDRFTKQLTNTAERVKSLITLQCTLPSSQKPESKDSGKSDQTLKRFLPKKAGPLYIRLDFRNVTTSDEFLQSAQEFITAQKIPAIQLRFSFPDSTRKGKVPLLGILGQIYDWGYSCETLKMQPYEKLTTYTPVRLPDFLGIFSNGKPDLWTSLVCFSRDFAQPVIRTGPTKRVESVDIENRGVVTQ